MVSIPETDRLFFRLLSAQELAHMAQDPDSFCRDAGLIYRAEPVEGEYREILRKQAQTALRDEENLEWRSFWLIGRKEDGAIVGSFDFKAPPDENGEVEIGYGLGDEARHRGYMTETVGAACRWAFSQAGVLAVTAETERWNAASQAVLRRCGFQITSQEKTLWWRIMK